MEFIIKTPEELPALVDQLLTFAGDRKKFFLIGDLGAGKTTFTKAICEKFKVKEMVSSPTYSLINEYAYLDKSGAEKLINHIDLYRLKDIDEAINIGIEDYLYNEDYCFIEWPEIIKPIAPEDVITIQFELLSDSSRKILFL